jgi:predicted short-subunit dehydrogenase-like oxidoreductase (DUF2520 family)
MCKLNFPRGRIFFTVNIAGHDMLTQQMPETLSIVGAGRVGRSLGRRLHELGWRVDVVMTRSIPTARAAVRIIGAGHATDRLTRQLLVSDVVLLATPDGAIANVAADLARLGGNEWRGKIVLHTSGALDSSALGALADEGAAVGSIHPMQTFSGQSTPGLAGTVFGIDGSPAAQKVARKMIRQMGGVAVRLSGANKAAYHAAGTFACAHVLALMEAATRLLMSQGFKRRQATRALLTLTRQTLDNLERIGPRGAWTGPLTRGDFTTVKRHVDALSDFSPEYLDAYRSLSRLTAAVLSDNSGELLEKLEAIVGQHRAAGHGMGRNFDDKVTQKKSRKKFAVVS